MTIVQVPSSWRWRECSECGVAEWLDPDDGRCSACWYKAHRKRLRAEWRQQQAERGITRWQRGTAR